MRILTQNTAESNQNEISVCFSYSAAYALDILIYLIYNILYADVNINVCNSITLRFCHVTIFVLKQLYHCNFYVPCVFLSNFVKAKSTHYYMKLTEFSCLTFIRLSRIIVYCFDIASNVKKVEFPKELHKSVKSRFNLETNQWFK